MRRSSAWLPSDSTREVLAAHAHHASRSMPMRKGESRRAGPAAQGRAKDDRGAGVAVRHVAATHAPTRAIRTGMGRARGHRPRPGCYSIQHLVGDRRYETAPGTGSAHGMAAPAAPAARVGVPGAGPSNSAWVRRITVTCVEVCGIARCSALDAHPTGRMSRSVSLTGPWCTCPPALRHPWPVFRRRCLWPRPPCTRLRGYPQPPAASVVSRPRRVRGSCCRP